MDNRTIRETWAVESNNTAEMWDRRADQFDSHPIPDESETFLKEVISVCEEDDVVLDIGCGAGTYSIPISRHVSKVVGLDISPVMISRAKAKAESHGRTNCEFHVFDWTAEDPADLGEFDVVIAHMAPAISSYGSFMKMVDVTGRSCFMTRSILRENNITANLSEHGIVVEDDAARDLVFAMNVLWNIGYEPTVFYEDREFESWYPAEEYTDRIRGSIGDTDIDDDLEEVLSETIAPFRKDDVLNVSGRMRMATLSFTKR